MVALFVAAEKSQHRAIAQLACCAGPHCVFTLLRHCAAHVLPRAHTASCALSGVPRRTRAASSCRARQPSSAGRRRSASTCAPRQIEQIPAFARRAKNMAFAHR
eukprot:1533366-Pleurochrysis_carterae.AAC.3